MSTIYKNVIKNNKNDELYKNGRSLREYLKFPKLSPEILKIKQYNEKLNDFVNELDEKPKTLHLFKFILKLNREEELQKQRNSKAKHLIELRKYVFFLFETFLYINFIFINKDSFKIYF